MTIRNFAFAVLALFATVQLNVNAAELKWTTDLPKAIAQAKAEKKVVMVNFTGSDWCIWCIRLDKEIFAEKAFIDYAEKNVVAVKIDFPRKAEQSAELKKTNEALQEKYKIEGFPTIVVLDGEGKDLGRLGYMAGGPGAFIKNLEKLKK